MAQWTYRDRDGAILGLVYRFDRKGEKQFGRVFFEPAAGGANRSENFRDLPDRCEELRPLGFCLTIHAEYSP